MGVGTGGTGYVTTRGRAALGLVAGVGLFVLLTVVGVTMVALLRKSGPHGARYVSTMALAVAMVGGGSFAVAALFLLPLLWWLNRHGRLSVWWAALLGGACAAVIMLLAVAAFGAAALGRFGGLTPERYVLFLGQSWSKCLFAVLFGALAGALAWRVAYRRGVDVAGVF
ncbi:MAG: GlyGly-CTERM sorting domain-containing protein [Proteobacteria bacterium]|nr:GlyGly-CTERM sorting domain-containing protein [Pseudomonadota bacterium]